MNAKILVFVIWVEAIIYFYDVISMTTPLNTFMLI